ncbi:hypothetical protein [Runella sp. SP2]|uniref:hypothetical protein n=1 Tax=Runella sp. SP2 TaxID=2268026 RepID=UPI000F0999EC|nr:hypothetical protein [Runella sp. SP2]AYQ35456.1 hypothetical protein DTQ70_26275 [Runella sp. SP2]
MVQASNPRKLTNGQAMLLQLFERDLPEEELVNVRNVLTQYFFQKAEQEADKAMKAKGKTIAQLDEEIRELNEKSRTDALKNLRNKS